MSAPDRRDGQDWDAERQQLEDRIARLEHTNDALARRVERQVDDGRGSHSLFEAARVLEAKVQERTHKLEEVQGALLRTNQDLIQALAEVEQAARDRADFLAQVSHEIRTPMNGVLGMLELMIGREDSERIRGDLEVVQQSAQGMLRLLDDLLDYSKAEAGAIELDEVPFDLAASVEDIVELFSDAAGKKGIGIHSHLERVPPCRVIGDGARIRQVLSNLISNAVKFTESGSVRLSLDCEVAADDTARVLLAVRDTGIGIPEDSQRRILEPFCQADRSTSRRFGGTGLGLSICTHLIESMGGELQIESEEGLGSTFSVQLTLPLEAGARESAALDGQTLAGWNCLMWLDPDLGDLSGIADKLRVLRANVCAVATVEAAIEKLETTKVDFVLLGSKDLLQARPRLREVFQQKCVGRPVFVLLPREGVLDEDGAFGGFEVIRTPLRRRRLLERLLEGQRGPTPRTAEPSRPGAEEPSFRVLLAEDNEINRMVAVRTIQKLGHRVDVAVHGREAVEFLERADYDVILMDCQMPEMDGFEATARIRAMPGHKARTPILALTANVLEGERERCLAAGMDEYLAKPFDPRTLAAAIVGLVNPQSSAS